MRKGESQATAILNGWEFQYASALYLLISNISNYSSIGFEKKEDIVLNRKDKTIDYAQAKSSETLNEIYNAAHYEDIKKSLKTLSKKDHKKRNKSIIIFNYRNPFGNDLPNFYSGKNASVLTLTQLPTNVKEKIQNHIILKKYNFDEEKLIFNFLSYDTGSELDYLNDLMRMKLSEIDYFAPSKSELILLKWKDLLSNNGRVRTGDVKIDAFVGALYSQLISKGLSIQHISEAFDLDCPAITDKIESELDRYFNKKAASILPYCKVLAGFIDFANDNKNKDLKKRDIQKLFIHSINNVPEEFDMFFTGSDSEKLLLYKYFCCYVLEKDDSLQKVNEVFDYDY